jgi:c-di-GMP-binding flagellar brake protein YcgR
VFQIRKFPRVSKEYRVSYSRVDQEQFDRNPVSSLTVNISGGGICFNAEEPLAKGTMVALDIDADDLHSSILALAKVRWCKTSGHTYEVGAEFWWIGWRDHEAQTTVADFIAASTAVKRRHHV